jgi:hypothetical protein
MYEKCGRQAKIEEYYDGSKETECELDTDGSELGQMVHFMDIALNLRFP